MPEPLDYHTPEKTPRRVIVLLAIGTSMLVGNMIWKAWRSYHPPRIPVPPALLNLNKYQADSRQIMDDPALDDVARATKLLKLLRWAYANEVATSIGGSPSLDELELALLLSNPSVQAAIGPADCDRFTSELRDRYPSVDLSRELNRARWLHRDKNRTTQPASRPYP